EHAARARAGVEVAAVGVALAFVGERVAGADDRRRRGERDVADRGELHRARAVAGHVHHAGIRDAAAARDRDQAPADDETVRLDEIAARLELAGIGDRDVTDVGDVDVAAADHLKRLRDGQRTAAEIEVARARRDLDVRAHRDARAGARAARRGAEDVRRVGDRVGAAGARNRAGGAGYQKDGN